MRFLRSRRSCQTHRTLPASACRTNWRRVSVSLKTRLTPPECEEVKNVPEPRRTREAPLRHINCRNLTLESADKLTKMSSRIQDTTYFAVFLQTIQESNPAEFRACRNQGGFMKVPFCIPHCLKSLLKTYYKRLDNDFSVNILKFCYVTVNKYK